MYHQVKHHIENSHNVQCMFHTQVFYDTVIGYNFGKEWMSMIMIINKIEKRNC